MFRIAVCSSQTNDKNETSRTIQKWIKRNITADAELCQVESVEELQNIMETQPDKYNFCIMDMPALKSAFEAQTEQKKHPLLIHGTDSIRHIFVEDIMYAENSLRRITTRCTTGRRSSVSGGREVSRAQSGKLQRHRLLCSRTSLFLSSSGTFPNWGQIIS